MSGPTCAILLPIPSEDPETLVDQLIDRVAREREGGDFWVSDTHTIGGSFRGDGRPFLGAVELDDRSDEEIARIEERFGWRPAGSLIVLSAMCNQPEDHAILAEIAAWAADRVQGLVDMCGDVPILASDDALRIAYDTISDHTAEYLVVSPHALRSWRQEAGFFMVK